VKRESAVSGPFAIDDPASTALLLLDLQNDFIHPDGAYARAGVTAPAIAALPGRLAPVAAAARRAGVLVASTLFTLVPGRGGAPMIADHLRRLRPFLRRGDFLPGGWGQALVDELQPADIAVEKVAFSAFYMSRLDWVLAKAGIRHLVCAGIVSNGGVASTVREAHVREYRVSVIEDGCAAFTPALHRAAMADLASVAALTDCAAVMAACAGAGGPR
jgi:nicotinamidase-related amidase